jgi:hypothetical protein
MYMYVMLPEYRPTKLKSHLRRNDMNRRFQMQGGKNWILPKEMNANRFFMDFQWLKI